MAFYDMTTIRAEGLATVEGDVRHFGMAKEGLIARQFMLGVVQTSEGLPIYPEVFDGNTAETWTLLPIVRKVMDRFPNLRRLVLVADRGLLSLDNLTALQAIRLKPHRSASKSNAVDEDPPASTGQALEFIIAVPGRRYGEFAGLLDDFQRQCVLAAVGGDTTEITGEIDWNGLRLVVAHNPVTALEQHQKRQARMAELESLATQWVGTLDDQDQGAAANVKKKRGRKLSDSGTKARFYRAVCDAHFAHIIKVDLKAELFSYSVDEKALALAQMRETQFNFERVIPMAQRLSAAGPKAPILARLDSGFDSTALMRQMESYNDNGAGVPQVDWLIKWNPRTTSVAGLAERLDGDTATVWEHPRAGKRVTLWEEALHIEGIGRPLRRVLHLTERTIDAKGQLLIEPRLQLDGWTTSLSARQFDAKAIVALYADHGTHEQFHSEFKTDLDLERLPSGKFSTNYLVRELAALAMNILRLMGQAGLLGPDAPVRHAAKRRRIETVMQELIYRAGRLIEHGRRIILGLGANDRSARANQRLHGELFAACG